MTTHKKKVSLLTSKGIPIIYVYLYKKLAERFKRYRVIDIKEMISINRNIVHQIPSKYDYTIIRDLISYGLVIKINRYKCSLVLDNYDKIVSSIDEYWAWE